MIKLGSLFDGSGTCPLVATMLGAAPVWASEVEPYPIAVTKHNLPDMKHYGNIVEMNGAEIEPVDIITFGSPCQDLSVAGKRAGIQDGERSNLFFEAIRIIKEMREATSGKYPRFIMWENVPGAFSSNKGHDFHAVLEAVCSICNGSALLPKPCDQRKPDKLVWNKAGHIVGSGYSVAWRTLDAQFWGVPQRRKRIFLVADFGGQRAGEILFKPDGLRGHPTESRETRERVTTDAERSIDGGRGVKCIAAGFKAGQGKGSIAFSEDTAATLQACGSGIEPSIVIALQANGIDRADTAGCNGSGWHEDVSYTLNTIDRHAVCFDVRNLRASAESGTLQAKENGGYSLNYQNPVCYPDVSGTPCASGAGLNRPAGQANETDMCVAIPCTASGEQTFGTLQASCAEKQWPGNQKALSGDYHILEQAKPPRKYILRRLTPLECCRLQGFPDGWTDIPTITDMTDEEYDFWSNVLKTKAGIDGKPYKQKNKAQAIKWYNKLHTDSAEYKMWGNGMALPCVLYVACGIVAALEESP